MHSTHFVKTDIVSDWALEQEALIQRSNKLKGGYIYIYIYIYMRTGVYVCVSELE